jgi:predicted transcriptional regulator
MKMAKPKHPPIGTRRVDSMMVKNVHSVNLTMTVAEVIQLILSKKISGAPVVNSVSEVISVVSQSDLIQFAALGGLDQQLLHFQDKLPSPEEIVFVYKHDTFKDVFKKFLTNPVRRVIVIDSTGKLQGIISRSTLLRIFLEENYQKYIAS